MTKKPETQYQAFKAIMAIVKDIGYVVVIMHPDKDHYIIEVKKGDGA